MREETGYRVVRIFLKKYSSKAQNRRIKKSTGDFTLKIVYAFFLGPAVFPLAV